MGILAVTAAALMFFRSPPEPTYAEKTLTYWLDYAVRDPNTASVALHAIGKDALPFIIDDLRARDTGFDLWLRGLLAKQRFIKSRSRPAAWRQRRAIAACTILRSNAVDALPALEALLPLNTNKSINICSALFRIGPPAEFILLRAFTNATYSREVRGETISFLQLMFLQPDAPADPTPLLNHLQPQLLDPQPFVRRNAAEAIGWIPRWPELRLPMLVPLLADTNVTVRVAAVARLGRLRNFTNAEPHIRRAMADGSVEVRLSATNALKNLYPPPPPNYE